MRRVFGLVIGIVLALLLAGGALAAYLLAPTGTGKVTLEVIGSGINSSGAALQLAVLRGWNLERFAVGVERGRNFLEIDAPAMGLNLDLRLPARGFANLETLGATCQALLIDDRALKFVTTKK